MKSKESYRPIYLNIGFIVALSLTITAFKWETYVSHEVLTPDEISEGLDDMVFITKFDEPKPPKPKIIRQIIEVTEDPIEVPEPIALDPGAWEDISFEATDEPITESIVEPTYFPEVKPSPEGGFTAFYDQLNKELNYPLKARKIGIQGKVFVSFIIDINGNITNIKLERGIGGGCDEEAIRALKTMPAWSPGRSGGRRVPVIMVLPIHFALN